MSTALMEPLAPSVEFSTLASDDQIERTVRALEANHMEALVVDSGDEARARVLGLIPAGAQVYNSVSRTLELIGLTADIEQATAFQPARPMIRALDRSTQMHEIRRLVSSPEVLVGSVQAITEQGQVLLASATGNQLAAAAFGASRVIWVAGTQKIVRDLDEGVRRVREYCQPIEDVRTRQVYGQPSAINKLLVVNADLPGRITVVLVKQKLGV